MRRADRLAFVLALVAALAVSGCDDGNECGPGTVADGDRCVPACEGGTRWDAASESCVSVCADGTEWNAAAGECVAELECGPGTREEDGACVPDELACGDGTEWSEAEGGCVPTCVPGTTRDGESGACLPDSAECVSGQVYDPEAGECVPVEGFCAEGTVWLASAAGCVPVDDLLEADQVEGAGENDPFFDGVPEEFVLPAVGGAIVLGGTIETPEDKDGDGALDGDLDYWMFSVAGPTLVRVGSDGVGGASSGFAVVSMEPDGPLAVDYRRFAIGTTRDGAVRDLYLPQAGSYAIVATDAMNLLGPPYFGGETFGYFLTVERLAPPTPTTLGFAGETASQDGLWPIVEPLLGGPMLGFYSVELPVDAGEIGGLFTFSLSTESVETSPILMVFDDSGLLLQAEGSALLGLEGSDAVTVVADYLVSFAVGPVGYRLTVRDEGLTSVEGDSPPITVNQPAWELASGEPYPWSYFGFLATAGEVVTLAISTTSTDTYFEVTDSRLTSWYGSFEGRSGVIRFYAPETGLYVIHVLDLEGAEWSWFGPESIPANEAEVDFDLFRQRPDDLGTVTAAVVRDGVTVTAAEWEAFFTLAPPAAGEALWFEIAGAPGFSPEASFYDLSGAGPLVSVATYTEDSFPVLFPEAGPLLLGVADGGAAGSFDLVVRPLAIEDLGALSASAAISRTGHALADGEAAAFFRFTPDVTGMATITVTPHGFDAELATRDGRLGELSTRDAAGPDGAETATVFVAAGLPAFFSVAVRDGAAFSSDAVDVSITLGPIATETEVNDGAALADPLTPPATVLGAIMPGGDQDWFSVTVTGASTLRAETRPLPGEDPYSTDTTLTVYGTDGTTGLAFDDDGGVGLFSLIAGVTLPAAGTYFVVVRGYSSSSTGDYLLDLALTTP